MRVKDIPTIQKKSGQKRSRKWNAGDGNKMSAAASGSIHRYPNIMCSSHQACSSRLEKFPSRVSFLSAGSLSSVMGGSGFFSI